MINKRLDLHGMLRQDAFYLVEDTLLDLSNKGSFSITIITGNSKPMKEGVIEVCNKHGFNYVVPSYNLGVVNVDYISF